MRTQSKVNADRRARKDSDEVGYCKPPKGKQFKKGISGNPKGRPKGAKNRQFSLVEEKLKSLIKEEAYRNITMQEGTRAVQIPLIKGILRSMGVKAAQGNARCQAKFVELLTMTEREEKRASHDFFQTAIDYKNSWTDALARRKALGIRGLADPSPHPDDIVVDYRNNTIEFKGPISLDEKKQQDWVRARQQDYLNEKTSLENMLAAEQDEGERRMLTTDLEHTQKILGIIAQNLGEGTEE